MCRRQRTDSHDLRQTSAGLDRDVGELRASGAAQRQLHQAHAHSGETNCLQGQRDNGLVLIAMKTEVNEAMQRGMCDRVSRWTVSSWAMQRVTASSGRNTRKMGESRLTGVPSALRNDE